MMKEAEIDDWFDDVDKQVCCFKRKVHEGKLLRESNHQSVLPGAAGVHLTREA